MTEINRRKRLLTVFAGVVVLGVGIPLVVHLTTSSIGARRDVPLRRLLVAGSAAPPEQAGWILDTGAFNLGIRFGTKDNLERIWRRSDGARIFQTVLRYRGLGSAKTWYSAALPSKNTDYITISKSNPLFRGRTADESEMICGSGKLRECGTWDYLGRYGQYLVEIKYIGGGGDNIGVTTFEAYANAIDSHVTELVGR